MCAKTGVWCSPTTLPTTTFDGEVEFVLGAVAAQDELREIHHQAGIEVGIGQPAPALESILQLDDAFGHGHVETLHRRRA